MKLITKDILAKMPKLYSTEKTPIDQKNAFVKFFTPDSNWTWYAVEGEVQENGDILFFGLVEGFDRDWGYFTLHELESVRGAYGLPVERDMHFSGRISL